MGTTRSSPDLLTNVHQKVQDRINKINQSDCSSTDQAPMIQIALTTVEDRRQEEHSEYEVDNSTNNMPIPEWDRICKFVPKIHQPHCIDQMVLAVRAVDVVQVLVFGFIREAARGHNLEIPRDIQVQTSQFVLRWSSRGRNAANLLLKCKRSRKLTLDLIRTINILWAEPAIHQIFESNNLILHSSTRQFWNKLKKYGVPLYDGTKRQTSIAQILDLKSNIRNDEDEGVMASQQFGMKWSDDVMAALKRYCLREEYDLDAIMQDLESYEEDNSLIIQDLARQFGWNEETAHEFVIDLRRLISADPGWVKRQLSPESEY